MDDAFAVENAHGSRDLLQEDPDGILAERSFGWEKGRKEGKIISLTPSAFPALRK